MFEMENVGLTFDPESLKRAPLPFYEGFEEDIKALRRGLPLPSERRKR